MCSLVRRVRARPDSNQPHARREYLMCMQQSRRFGSGPGTIIVVARRHPAAPWRGRATLWETRARASVPQRLPARTPHARPPAHPLARPTARPPAHTKARALPAPPPLPLPISAHPLTRPSTRPPACSPVRRRHRGRALESWHDGARDASWAAGMASDAVMSARARQMAARLVPAERTSH